MINFPHNPFKRAANAVHPLAPVRQTFIRDILWNRPVFKAPALPIPAVEIEAFAPARLDWGQTLGFATRSNEATFTAARVTKAAR